MRNPTFNSMYLPDGTTVLRCKQTGTKYLIAQAGREFALYRDGKLIRTGDRKTVVDAVESDAKWAVHS